MARETKKGSTNKPDVDKDGLLKLLESGNEEKCLEFFRGMPEKTRREYFAVVKPFCARIRKAQWIEDPPGTFHGNPLSGIACVAFFATATGSEIVKARRAGYPSLDMAFEILADRRPDWVDQWVESLLGESSYWMNWRIIRRLIQAGMATKPTNPRYYLGMISGINSRFSKRDLADELLQAPDLLEDDIWKLFEYDGDGENSLANTERFDKSWISAFVQLSKQGKLPRGKLLEASVSALERDFNHYRAKWFFEFFDRLEPSVSELQIFSDRLLGLLGASAPNVAAWALNRVEALSSIQPYQTSALCHAIEPILRARAKSSVLLALKLLERQAAAFPADVSQIALAATAALSHEVPDVQIAALRLLETLSSPADPTVRRAVQESQSGMAASVRKRASAWLEEKSSAPKSAERKSNKAVAEAGDAPRIAPKLQSLYSIDKLQIHLANNRLEVPAAIFDGTDIPRLVRTAAITPIESIEELIDVCARVIEDGSLVDDAERCIDGLARLVHAKPPDFEMMSAPLLKRIRKLVSKGCTPFCGFDPGNDVAGLFYAFCTGVVTEPKSKARELAIEFEGEEYRQFKINTTKPIGFLSAHCLAVARRIAAGLPQQLLSSPTHAGGWIDPQQLVRRVNEWTGDDPGSHDVILAILRLAPDNRPTALSALRTTPTQWNQAIRYALGAQKIDVGDQSALWVAAARARAPWSDDLQIQAKHPGLGPDAGEAANFQLRSKVRKSGSYTFYDASINVTPAAGKVSDNLLVTVRMIASREVDYSLAFEMGGFAGRTNGAVRWTATIWPQARESFFAASAIHCIANIDWSEAVWQNRTMLEPLIDSGTPLRYVGLIFLTSMLAAKEPGEAGLATDIAIRAIEDGRLGSDNLGDALAQLLVTGIIKPGRWHKTLAEVARASRVHASVIQVALQRCFEDPSIELPKDTSKLLELLNELSLDLGVAITYPPCRNWLSSDAVTGKAVKLAKSLLAIEETPESKATIQEIIQAAIVQRTSAAHHQTVA